MQHLSLALSLAIIASSVVVAAAAAAAALMLVLRGFVEPCFRCSRTGADDVERRAQASRVADEPPAADAARPKEIRRFSWDEVEALTGKFTAAVIGVGGFSTVYLGRLPDFPAASSSSAAAAFKVQHSSERLYRAFLQERDVLLNARHPNIVQLLGYSDDRGQGVLVFEYVPNGTLHEMLHGNGDGRTPSTPLPWSRRMSIIYQAASAVDYLHDGCDLQIVHGDLTASNVLLDGSLNPKLCDFGSARMGFSAAVKPAAVGHIVASPGYADPHYLRTGIISKKSDVYSFGVLILELITGIPAVGSGDERMLTVMMREKGWDQLATMVDPALGAHFDAGELEAMGAIAGRCVGGRPGLRPSMGEIIRIMKERVRL